MKCSWPDENPVVVPPALEKLKVFFKLFFKPIITPSNTKRDISIEMDGVKTVVVNTHGHL